MSGPGLLDCEKAINYLKQLDTYSKESGTCKDAKCKKTFDQIIKDNTADIPIANSCIKNNAGDSDAMNTCLNNTGIINSSLCAYCLSHGEDCYPSTLSSCTECNTSCAVDFD